MVKDYAASGDWGGKGVRQDTGPIWSDFPLLPFPPRWRYDTRRRTSIPAKGGDVARRVLVRGIGDVGSAVAHCLHGAGYAVAIHDGPQPTVTRRGMAFSDAMYDGSALLDGLEARRVDGPTALAASLEDRAIIPVAVGTFSGTLAAVAPDVLIDARMRKRATPEAQRGLASLVIGLGPNFVAGGNVDLAVETSWDNLGAVIASGPTLDLAGEPRSIAGHARDRYVYAPQAGTFRTDRALGDTVEVGSVIASVGGTALVAPMTGVLRGLTRDGVPVAAGTKVIEVDPRSAPILIGIGERPGRIAAGVLRALRMAEVGIA